MQIHPVIFVATGRSVAYRYNDFSLFHERREQPGEFVDRHTFADQQGEDLAVLGCLGEFSGYISRQDWGTEPGADGGQNRSGTAKVPSVQRLRSWRRYRCASRFFTPSPAGRRCLLWVLRLKNAEDLVFVDISELRLERAELISEAGN